MKRNALIPICLALLSQFAVAEDTWQIPERTLQPPAGASEALQAAISGAGQPDVAARKAIVASTEADWRRLQQARAQAQAVDLEALQAAQRHHHRDTMACRCTGSSPPR